MTAKAATVRTAVVIMTKEPVAGRTKTRLTPVLSPADAARLYEALLCDTIALVSGVRRVRVALAVTPASAVGRWRPPGAADALLLPVDGATLGDCLAEATRQAFDAGFSRVIAINSDGPTLPAVRIEEADILLASIDVVVGPSEDGGYYLIGMRRPDAGLFRHIAWSSEAVLSQTLDRAAALGRSVAVLAPWYDVDTPADVERLRAELALLPVEALLSTRQFFAAGGAAGAVGGNGSDSNRGAATSSGSFGQEAGR
jgi:rSAM/selenodomain-associated transferase 1